MQNNRPAGAYPAKGGKMAKRGGAREGSGRKKMDGAVYTSIRIDAASWERIPKPKAAYVRKAVAEKLERDLEVQR